MTTPTPSTTARCKVRSPLSKASVRVQLLSSCTSGHGELADLGAKVLRRWSGHDGFVVGRGGWRE